MPPLPPYVADTLVHNRLSVTRKLVMLAMFCIAQSLDSFNISALLAVIPVLDISLGMTQTQTIWIFSSSQLTLSSFLLISGRLSDVYNSKTVFIGGVSSLGALSLGAGFTDTKIPLITLRAFTGIASAMTIPSALTLIVKAFPDPHEQARAIGLFGGCGAIANVIGLVLGAIFVQWASYHYVFWFVALVALPVGLASVFIIPSQLGEAADNPERKGAKWKNLDLVGVSILTGSNISVCSSLHRSRALIVAVILFIFAVISGSTNGWKSPMVLVPLIVSILMVVGFFYWETRLPVEKAAIPPRTWFYNNFSVLFAIALFPFLWWNALMIIFSTMWQNVFNWSIMSAVIHMLPMGVVAFALSAIAGPLSRIFNPKWVILTGLTLAVVATVLLALGGGKPEYYWPFVFPAFSLGTAGIMMTYSHTNIAIFQAVPSSMAGTVGAIFNGALQFGSAVGLAISSSMESSVESTHGGFNGYAGRAAVCWLLVAIGVTEIISLSIFYDRSAYQKPQPNHNISDLVQEGAQSDEKISDVYIVTMTDNTANLQDLPMLSFF